MFYVPRSTKQLGTFPRSWGMFQRSKQTNKQKIYIFLFFNLIKKAVLRFRLVKAIVLQVKCWMSTVKTMNMFEKNHFDVLHGLHKQLLSITFSLRTWIMQFLHNLCLGNKFSRHWETFSSNNTQILMRKIVDISKSF